MIGRMERSRGSRYALLCVLLISAMVPLLPMTGWAQSAPSFVWQLRAGGTIGDSFSVCSSANTSYSTGSNTFVPMAGMNLYPVSSSDLTGGCDDHWTSWYPYEPPHWTSGVLYGDHGVDIIATPPPYYVSAKLRPNTDCKTTCLGDPINPVDGAVIKREDDYVSPSRFGGPGFARFYSSSDISGTDLSPGWRHSYSRHVAANYTVATIAPYDASDANNSPLYADPASACLNGFVQIRGKVSAWGNATTSSYTGTTCVLTKAGVNIGTLTVLHDGLPPLPTPSPSPVSYD